MLKLGYRASAKNLSVSKKKFANLYMRFRNRLRKSWKKLSLWREQLLSLPQNRTVLCLGLTKSQVVVTCKDPQTHLKAQKFHTLKPSSRKETPLKPLKNSKLPFSVLNHPKSFLKVLQKIAKHQLVRLPRSTNNLLL